MDAKYNWLMDNMAVRVTINLTAFSAWVVAAYWLLR